MKLAPFLLEEYLAKREFSAKYMFSASDLQSRSISDILAMLSPREREEFMDLPLGYTLPEGNLELRREIAGLYSGLSAENILCFAGAEEGIYSAAQALLGPDDHVIAIDPCYQSLEAVAASICQVSKVSLEIKDGNWYLDPEKIAAAIKPHTKMLFCNFPHNPTGYIPKQETFAGIVALAKKHSLILFSDEVYRGLEIDPADRLPSACDMYTNALSLGVMSKSFGFAGLRIGWIATQNHELLQALGHYKHYLSICNSAPSEWLSTVILRNRAQILRENTSLVRSNLQQVRSYFLSEPDSFTWLEPQGGCIAYPRYLGKASILDLADALLKAKSLVILPDWVYGQKNQHFRVAFGRRNGLEALQHFRDFFKENPEWK